MTILQRKTRDKMDVVRRVNRSDGRTVEILRTPSQWESRREELRERAGSRCEAAGCFHVAPIHDVYWPDTNTIRWYAGHAAHIRNRKAGGGSRDDSMSNLRWLCRDCHSREHVAAKVVPNKVGA